MTRAMQKRRTKDTHHHLSRHWFGADAAIYHRTSHRRHVSGGIVAHGGLVAHATHTSCSQTHTIDRAFADGSLTNRMARDAIFDGFKRTFRLPNGACRVPLSFCDLFANTSVCTLNVIWRERTARAPGLSRLYICRPKIFLSLLFCWRADEPHEPPAVFFFQRTR
jgi:hypothetical protein